MTDVICALVLAFTSGSCYFGGIMEVPETLKPDVNRLLLGPLSLAADLYGAVIPGCVFLILICIKKHWVSQVLTYPLVGYKTKVVLGLLASYIVGKVFLSAFTVVVGPLGWLLRKGAARLRKRQATAAPEQPNRTRLGLLLTTLLELLEKNRRLRAFVGALVSGAVLFKFQLMDHYTAHKAAVTFHISTGLVLITCSFIPGDGNFRSLEFWAGLILLIAGFRATRDAQDMFPSAAGLALSSFISNLTPDQFSVVAKVVAGVVTKLYETPNPAATPAAAADPPVADPPA
jgi:hypothetical protein